MATKYTLTLVREFDLDPLNPGLCSDACGFLQHINGHVTMPKCVDTQLEFVRLGRTIRAVRSRFCREYAKEVTR